MCGYLVREKEIDWTLVGREQLYVERVASARGVSNAWGDQAVAASAAKAMAAARARRRLGMLTRVARRAVGPQDDGLACVRACDADDPCEHTFVTRQGSAYARFQRALKTGNLTLIRNAASELPRVDLGDALHVCVAIRRAEPERFQRAALRWLARFCLERREATIAQVQAAAWAFDNLADEPAALETLQRLCAR
jgi:hypothetical protein